MILFSLYPMRLIDPRNAPLQQKHTRRIASPFHKKIIQITRRSSTSKQSAGEATRRQHDCSSAAATPSGRDLGNDLGRRGQPPQRRPRPRREWPVLSRCLTRTLSLEVHVVVFLFLASAHRPFSDSARRVVLPNDVLLHTQATISTTTLAILEQQSQISSREIISSMKISNVFVAVTLALACGASGGLAEVSK